MKIAKKNHIIWNTKKEGSWLKYLAKTESNEELDEVVVSARNDVNKLMNTKDKVMNRTKYVCFGKVSVNKTRKEERNVERLQRKKIELGSGENVEPKVCEEIDGELANALGQLNNANFEREINSLKTTWLEKGKSAAVFDLKRRVLGSKKSSMEAVAITNPESGALVSSTKEIK